MDRMWAMQNQIDVEAIRSKLKAMSRAEVMKLATKAGLAHSTIEKFRLNRITEPRLSRLQAMAQALSELEPT